MSVNADDHVARKHLERLVPRESLIALLAADDFDVAEAVVRVFEIHHLFIGAVGGHTVHKHDLDFFVGIFLKCDIPEKSVDGVNLVVGDHTQRYYHITHRLSSS